LKALSVPRDQAGTFDRLIAKYQRRPVFDEKTSHDARHDGPPEIPATSKNLRHLFPPA
jgi:hypothetical protein